MFVFAAVLMWLIGILYGISECSGFAAVEVFIVMAPVLFIVRIVLYVIGMTYSDIRD